jgi:glutamate racemase
MDEPANLKLPKTFPCPVKARTPARRPRQLPIGIFDSGVGGLTVVRQVHRVLPREDIVYLGDTARVPYGTKSPATVVRFACEDAQFLMEREVKCIVVACNTASAWALPTLEKEFSVPVFGVILPGAQAALAHSRNHRIGVIGTKATIGSDAYPRAILALHGRAKVFPQPCPLLVPLVEEGWTRHPVTEAVLRQYLVPLLQRRIDTLVLGCTHYPLLKAAIQRVTGPEVKLVDSAQTCAAYVRSRLHELGLLRAGRRRQGIIQPFVTDEAERFDAAAARFLGAPTARAVRVQLPSY